MARISGVTWALTVLIAVAVPMTASGQSLSASAAQQDFDLLRHALEEAHGGLYRYVDKAHLDARFAAHRARLARSVTQLELARVISEAIAEVRDGHNRLEFDSATMAAIAAAPLLPLRVALENDQVVVAFNDSPVDTSIRPGMQLVTINGCPARQVVQTLLPTVSGDGFIETGKRARLARMLPQLYWLFVEQPASFVVTARDAGRTVTATLAGVRDADRRSVSNPVNATVRANLDRLEGPAGNIALSFVSDSSVARLRIRAFDGSTFNATLDSAFRVLRDRGTPSLILDLRGNGGGVDMYGAFLVSHFVDAPFRYFDHIRLTTVAPSFATWLPRTFDATRAGTVRDSARGGFLVTPALHPGVAEQRPAPNAYRGKLVVLIDGGSFSTTADVAAQLRSRRRAIFIGEETAGTYDGNTSGLNAQITLPNSKLRLKVMMYGYWNAVVADSVPGRGIRPDHVVSRTIADVLRGADPVMERAISVLRSLAADAR